MEKQYRFIADSVNSGCTVLIYDWPVQSKVYNVTDISRVTMRDSILYIDGKPVIGKTIALKPKSWRK